jgi:hypothetical protein
MNMSTLRALLCLVVLCVALLLSADSLPRVRVKPGDRGKLAEGAAAGGGGGAAATAPGPKVDESSGGNNGGVPGPDGNANGEASPAPKFHEGDDVNGRKAGAKAPAPDNANAPSPGDKGAHAGDDPSKNPAPVAHPVRVSRELALACCWCEEADCKPHTSGWQAIGMSPPGAPIRLHRACVLALRLVCLPDWHIGWMRRLLSRAGPDARAGAKASQARGLQDLKRPFCLRCVACTP